MIIIGLEWGSLPRNVLIFNHLIPGHFPQFLEKTPPISVDPGSRRWLRPVAKVHPKVHHGSGPSCDP
jgi:hypothetical protein